MTVYNQDIAKILNQTADLLEIKGENQFRIRAYRNAALTVGSLSKSISDMIEKGEKLYEMPGIGKDLAGKIKKIVETGSFELLEDLKKEVPAELSGLMRISNLGAKRVKKVYDKLNVRSLQDLKKAAEEGKIRDLQGFGEKTEENILDGIARLEGVRERFILSNAEQYALPFLNYLKKSKKIKEISIAGSFRRRKETVGDIDILAAVKRGSDIMERFTKYEDVEKILSKGETKSTVILKSGLQIDLRVIQQVSYGAALLYFTGSKQHNIEIRSRAVKRKLKISEYGVFNEKDKRVAGGTEEEIYKTVDLPYIAPELRENRGEIEAAEKGCLPGLVELKDIKGDLHTHTKATDGRYTLEEMAEAAKKKGYEYMGNSEHTKRATVTGGLDEKGFEKVFENIDKINSKYKNFTVLKSAEVDILDDGSLDLADSILKEMDITVCSIHYKFGLSKKEQTKRVLKAMENPYFYIFGHPTGRLLGEREAYDIDMEAVLRRAADTGTFIEINAYPNRLDLNDIYCKRAKELGVKLAISTDAHSTDDLNFMRFGIGVARRGWLEPADILNTRSLKEMRKMIKK